MPHTIAVAGKGGVGKTTLTGLLIEYLCKKNAGPVLAVDADANSNLNEVLGVEAPVTLGEIREEVAQAELSGKNPIPRSFAERSSFAASMFTVMLYVQGISRVKCSNVFERFHAPMSIMLKLIERLRLRLQLHPHDVDDFFISRPLV